MRYFKGKILKEHYVVFSDGFIVNVKYDKKSKVASIILWKNKSDIAKFSTRGLEKEITEIEFKKSLKKQFGENGMDLIKRFEKVISGNKK